MLHTPRGLRGIVSSPHHLASQAGLDVLKDGGNAVEAAVAMAAALAVLYPHMTGIGGDGFWQIARADGSIKAIDACGGAAVGSTQALYAGRDAIPTRGPLAANTVAGTISGWRLALDTMPGALPLERLLRDAIHHAEAGAPVTASYRTTLADKRAELDGLPGFTALNPANGEVLRQPALAATLRRLAADGLDDFYRGSLAGDLAHDLSAAGSPVAAADLAAHRVRRVTPLRVESRWGVLHNLPPPTQGVASLLILALVDRRGPLGSPDGPAWIHALVEAVKRAFLFRDAEVGDPTTMAVDCQALLDDAAALDAMAADIDPAAALPWPRASAPGDTVWFGAIDGGGCAVSAIQSIYFEFGSGVVLPRTGIVWQNRGSSFTLGGRGPNRLRPGARPFHTLNPALARLKDGRLMVYGTMGGEGQPQTQAQLFTRYMAGAPLQEAVTAPRFLLGRTWGEATTSLKLENRFPAETISGLRALGHYVELVAPFSSAMGHAGALVRHADGLLEGAADPRSDGAVAAW